MAIISNKYGKSYDVPDDDKFWIKALSTSIYQIKNIDFIRSLKPKCRTIIDIGANLGSNTIEYATFSDKVVSFEPTPSTFGHLSNTVDLNRSTYTASITLENVGLGDEPGSMFIKCYTNNCGKNYVTETPSANTVEVQIKTLDSYNLTDVDFIKIDVEGFEHRVLLGGVDTIKKYLPIIQTEFVEEHMNRHGDTGNGVQQFLEGLGYRGMLRIGVPYSPENMKKSRITDVFWVHHSQIPESINLDQKQLNADLFTVEE